MRIAVFDVSNGSCALAVCSNGYSLMMDAGNHSEKECPVEKIIKYRNTGGWFSHMKEYINQYGVKYPLTKLVISHPDLDHIKNISTVHTKLTPGLLHRRYIEEFPPEIVHQDDEKYLYYKDKVCATYRDTNILNPAWAFFQKSYEIPMNTLKALPQFGETKLKNNSSIIYLLEYGTFRILFCGDMETAGWDWLIDNNYNNFRDDLSKGIDVLVASHHGHTSGYSQKLMNLIKNPKLTILSKGSETGKETDVDSRYSTNSTGVPVFNLATRTDVNKYTLTTRTNGNIYIDVQPNGDFYVMADAV